MQCKFEYILGYTCTVADSKIFNGSRVYIDAIIGQHTYGHYNDNVVALKIVNIKSLNFFPQNIASHFKYLKYIEVESANLQEISQNDLKVFTKLEHLYLNNNSIQIIDEQLFAHNRGLKTIWLQNNQISYIARHAFDGLDSLDDIDLSGSQCNSSFSHATKPDEVAEVKRRIRNGECIVNPLGNVISMNHEKFNKKLAAVNENFDGKLAAIDEKNQEKIQNLMTKMQENSDDCMSKTIWLLIIGGVFIILFIIAVYFIKMWCDKKIENQEIGHERADDEFVRINSTPNSVGLPETVDNSLYNEAQMSVNNHGFLVPSLSRLGNFVE